MSETDVKRRFVAAMSDWLVTLPHDLKMLYEASTDQDLDRNLRELAVGAIISTIDPGHLPGVPPEDFVNHCDGAIVLRLVLHRIGTDGGDDCEPFKDRFADFFESLDEEIALCEQALGDLYPWLQQKAERLPKLEYKGKKVPVYLDDEDAGEFLYEEGLEFQTEYDVDEDVVNDRLKKASTLYDALEKRRDADNPKT